ncbi:MAG: nodulation protein NfeD [Candidatus Aquicultor sp.]|nr:nodulation protein NfeD [Candidatus Aquicultor sp.]
MTRKRIRKSRARTAKREKRGAKSALTMSRIAASGRWTVKLVSLALIIVALFALAAPAQNGNQVILADVEGIIDPAVAEYVNTSIATAKREQAKALLIRMDTPGGLDTSMRMIIKDIFASEVPVIVYVAPTGSRAASAGTFITMAAHVAAMAPGTNIGAAHPVNMAGDMPEDIAKKAENDAVAFIRGIAKETGRNQNWAEDAVRESVSITSEKALELNVIDHVSPGVDSLLDTINGTSVKTAAGRMTLTTKDADVVERPMSFRQRMLHTLANPNVAYLLLILGFYGLIYEFANPGFGLSGVGGAIFIVLGLYSIQVLPVNYAGLVLIVLGVALLIGEAFNPGFGVLGAGGIIAMTVGSFILFESPLPGLRVSPYIVLPTVAVTAGFILIAVRMALHAQKRQPSTGAEGMIGLVGEVRSALTPRGEVFVHGERWSAESIEGTINVGDEVEIVSLQGLRLKVKRHSEAKNMEIT